MANTESLLTFNLLVQSVSGDVLFKADSVVFTSVATDSRLVQKNTLFIPLMGSNQDGHLYIEQSLQNSASIIFVDKIHAKTDANLYAEWAKKYNVTFIAVEHTLYALQNLAKKYVQQFPLLKKIGITGSSGKTTVKEIIAQLLAQKYSVVCNEGNFNSETGLPLSVFKIRSHHEIGVFELGMNRVGEIAEITDVLNPDVAVITNIGTAHIGLLDSKEVIAAEKKQIFKNFSEKSVGFIYENDDYADFLQKNVQGTIKTFGEKSCKNVSGVVQNNNFGTDFLYQGTACTLNVAGTHNFLNALAGIAIAELFDLCTKEIQEGFQKIKPLFGRCEILHGDYTIMQDCYNANPESMLSAIDFCDDLLLEAKSAKKIYILGDMLELGAKSLELHQEIGKRLLHSNADSIIFYGEQMSFVYEICKNFLGKVFHSTTMDELTKIVHQNAKKGDFILLKGSKGMKLWEVTRCLQVNGACHEK
ncbi:MAG: UDP-N-acetylmuramoyl-tripeptide--D-alanyl-D-alanine ligase [Treponemataceae bacterium]